MSAVLERPVRTKAGTSNGGVPARRAVTRWAWRLFRREWRQQLMVLALITAAVGATVIGAAVAVNTPPAANAGYGTAHDLATFPGTDRTLTADIARISQKYGTVDIIENQARTVPGSIVGYDLRAQNPHGPFGQPMLSLLSGSYPATASQVALTPGLAAALGLHVGSTYRSDGQSRTVTGIVQNPQSLLDEFALVIPGQVTAPTTVTVLFDAPGVSPSAIGPQVQTPGYRTTSNPLNPTTIVLALATVGMLLIALVAVGGFTVLAQRRLRSLGMLSALGATDRNVRLVVRANGVVVGVLGALAGLVLGVAGWLAYRPEAERSAHHLIGAFALPWVVIGPALALAVLATWFAASRPARAITRMSTVAALSGRPAPPKQVHRSVIPAVIFAVVGVVALLYSGKSNGNGAGAPELLAGLVCLVVALVLLAPLFLTGLAKAARGTPLAARLALRDLGRYRARSGSALAAIGLGVMIAMLVCVLSAARYGNVLDYAGPNLSSSQLIVYTPNGPYGPGGPGDGNGGGAAVTGAELKTADSISAALGSHQVIELESTSASLQRTAPGRQWSGPVYVATPQLLAAFGITDVNPSADILSMRPGLSGMSLMELDYGRGQIRPVIQEVAALPSGTSAPNTVITEHAVSRLGLSSTQSTAGWLILTPHPLTAAQITSARLAAASQGLTIETRSSAPSSAQILTWATVFGLVLALGIVAMSVGLIRSETAGDLRTLTATGASGWTRRSITAVTAGALALAGAVLGTAAAYLGAGAYSFDNTLDGLGELGSVPTWNLLVVLAGLPLAAAAAGWLLAGRQPPVISRQPLE